MANRSDVIGEQIASNMGLVGIFRESGRLLCKHFRLFVPFLLAFHLPSSCFTAFQSVFLVTSPHPGYVASFLKASALYATTASNQQAGEIVDTDSQGSLLALSYSLSALALVSGILATAATTCIVAHIYGTADSTTGLTDDSVARKVFKLMPHAFLRLIVTQLWIVLAVLMLIFACAGFAFLLDELLSAVIGGPSGPSPAFFLFAGAAFVIGIGAMAIMFANSASVAVLEREKYGRAALKQSKAYAKGRESLIFFVLVLSGAIGGLVATPLPSLASAYDMPLLVKITVTILISVLISVVDAYVVLIQVVMYFVCKCHLEAVLPEFQCGSNHISAAEIPYKPILSESSKP